MYKRPQPILDDVELIIDDKNEDTEANEIQPEEEEEEQKMEYDIPDESPSLSEFIDQEPDESEQSDESEDIEDNDDNFDDESQALPEHLRFQLHHAAQVKELSYLILSMLQMHS